jgi:serine/threonine-protein kinase
MEYVEGRSYRDLLGEFGRLAPEVVAQTLVACGDALSHAHRHGVLHNDLKPDNLLLQCDGIMKIVDFGIAGLIHAAGESEYVEGTPDYMSPEQLRGDPLDERSDEFALGVMACEFLTGRLPFASGKDLTECLRGRGSPNLDFVPSAVRIPIARAISADRDRRWPTVAECVEAIAGALAGLGSTSPAQA